MLQWIEVQNYGWEVWLRAAGEGNKSVGSSKLIGYGRSAMAFRGRERDGDRLIRSPVATERPASVFSCPPMHSDALSPIRASHVVFHKMLDPLFCISELRCRRTCSPTVFSRHEGMLVINLYHSILDGMRSPVQILIATFHLMCTSIPGKGFLSF